MCVAIQNMDAMDPETGQALVRSQASRGMQRRSKSATTLARANAVRSRHQKHNRNSVEDVHTCDVKRSQKDIGFAKRSS